MTTPQVGNAPGMIAVLPFYAAGAFFFLLLTVMAASSAFELTGHYFHPHILAIVHTGALGWGTMLIFGATYQLLPVICERSLWSDRMAFYSFILLVAGVTILIGTFWTFAIGYEMIIGGILTLTAAVLYAVNVFRTSGQSRQSSAATRCITTAAAWLLITMIIGLLLAVNLQYGFFKKNHLEVLKLHAHAGFAGWFLQLITGVSARLFPMFLLSKPSKPHYLGRAYLLQNIGLILFLTDQYVFGPSDRALLYAAIVMLGIIYWLLFLGSIFRNRIKKKIDLPMQQSMQSFAGLAGALMLFPLAYFHGDSRWDTAYGILLLLGWVTALILGKTFKTLPFIVWNKKYQALHGKARIPLPKQLYSEKLLRWQYWLFLLSLYLILLGICLHVVVSVQAGTGLLILVALLYCINVGKILCHKTQILN